ncbi:MAG: hypothetical protein ACI837_001457 [Crocinitomicaceae bacterium]|jgi:hypothetical protein
MKTISIITFALFLGMISCKKKGCIDATAANYSTEAEKDDESCTFNGHAVFWFTSVTATNLVTASIPNLDFYIDGVQEGSVSVTQFSVSEPTCAGSEGFTATISLGTSQSSSKSYSIKEGGTSNVIQSGTVSITNTPCKWIELNY